MALRFQVGHYLIELSVLALPISFTFLWITTFIFGYPIARRKGIGMLPAILWTFVFWAVVVFLCWLILVDKVALVFHA